MFRDLADPDLFGNEAGEDEDVDVLASYFLEKSEFEQFYGDRKKLAFVRARKGMGKSALLAYTQFQRQQADPAGIYIYVKASDLNSIQMTSNASASDMIYGWQQKICTRINLELGTALHTGFDDDSIYLIEAAEIAGFRKRNIISALFDRLSVKGGGIDISRSRVAATDSQAVLERIHEKKDVNVWMFIDDVDATFINTEEERIRVSTFFSACRNLVNCVSGLSLRASVRSDVWSILAQHDEALDKCEQYMLDLSWSTDETGRILERKIHSYLMRYYPNNHAYGALDLVKNRNEIRNVVFKEPFHWTHGPLESFRPIHILSAGRPRWAAQLCKHAGKDALSKNSYKISDGNVRAVLKRYGQFRIDDLYKEYRHQCNQIESIVESFSGGNTKYSTEELNNHITDKIIKLVGLPKIDGFSAENGALSISKFLYRIGFIMARDEEDKTGLGFVKFEDRPNLLSSKSNLDDGLIWEIHPSYRDVLRINKKERSKFRRTK
ncbi:TPA: hypothetical protein RVR73_003302 [Aeromonas hydrophila]|nr:hypothetical protein [Aeromonas hydrophila]